MSDKIKYIDIKEFREFGYLQEINRQFLHPLGLALEVVVEDDGSERLGGVWDSRDDPEGIVFGEGMIEKEKAQRVEIKRQRMANNRKEALGFTVQEVPITMTTDTVGLGINDGA